MKCLGFAASWTRVNTKNTQSSGPMKKPLVSVVAKQSTLGTQSDLVEVIEQSARLKRRKVEMAPAKSSGSQVKKSASYPSSRRAIK